jgi:hypothetical protein
MSEFTPIHEPSAVEREIYSAITAVQWFKDRGLIDEAIRSALTDELLDELKNPDAELGALIYAKTKKKPYDRESES